MAEVLANVANCCAVDWQAIAYALWQEVLDFSLAFIAKRRVIDNATHHAAALRTTDVALDLFVSVAHKYLSPAHARAMENAT
jgi:hypothetical protein